MTTFTFSHPVAGTISTANAKLKPTLCYMDLEADDKERKEGKFGFDKLTNSMVRNCKSDINILKNEYSAYITDGKEHYIPWLSIRKGQTIKLAVKTKVYQGNKIGTISVFGNDKGDFNVVFRDKDNAESNNIKTAETLEITCNRTNKENARLRFKVANEAVGGINIFYPEPKTVDIRCVMVLTKEGGKNIIVEKDAILENIGSDRELIMYFKKAFSPALLDINIVANKIHEVSIANDFDKNWVKYFDDKNNLRVKSSPIDRQNLLNDLTLYKANILFDAEPFSEEKIEAILNTKLSINNISLKPEKEPSTADKLIKRLNRPKKAITLFLTNFQNYNKIPNTEPEQYSAINGMSLVGRDRALMLLGNKGVKGISITPYSEIPHEIMHCLSLPHCFEENPKDMHWPYNYYKKASSDNYMDYQNTAKHTFHTQWRAMHVSKFTK